MIGTKLDMAKRAGRVNQVAGQTGHRLKTGHFERVKNEFGSIRFRVGSGQVDLYFSHDFFFILIFIKKTTCICHLESYATNYLI